MKTLILITIITWSFGSPLPNNNLSQIVGSPEEAAILVYQDQPPDFIAEPDQKAYRLYEVDFDKTTINQINIPKVSFAPCEPSP